MATTTPYPPPPPPSRPRRDGRSGNGVIVACFAVLVVIVLLFAVQMIRTNPVSKAQLASSRSTDITGINKAFADQQVKIDTLSKSFADQQVKIDTLSNKLEAATTALAAASAPANPAAATAPSGNTATDPSDNTDTGTAGKKANPSTPTTQFVDTCWNSIGKVSKGATVKVPAGCQVKGDVKIDGTWFYDTDSKTCQVTVMEKDATVIAKYGADVSSRSPESLKSDGCGAGVRVDIKRWPSDLGKFPLTKTG